MKDAQQSAVEFFSNSFLIERNDLQFTWEEKEWTTWLVFLNSI